MVDSLLMLLNAEKKSQRLEHFDNKKHLSLLNMQQKKDCLFFLTKDLKRLFLWRAEWDIMLD